MTELTLVILGKPLRVHYFQHIKGEGLGSLAQWLERQQAIISTTPFYKVPKGQTIAALPAIKDVDLLVIMGGAMSVNDEADYPWLVTEKKWIADYIKAGGAVLGLCLGGQLIASALGTAVKPNAHKEIGWWPVYGRPVAAEKNLRVFEFPQEIKVLSWHGDTFDLPQGAVWLAENTACPHQAYQYGERVLGFQFHPETTPENAALFLADDGYKDLTPGPFVQPAEHISPVPEEQFKAGNALLERAAEFVLQGRLT